MIGSGGSSSVSHFLILAFPSSWWRLLWTASIVLPSTYSGIGRRLLLSNRLEESDKGTLYRSPYIFVLCIERLNHLIRESIEKGEWKPIAASQGGPSLFNLFFADDLILFGEASKEQASIIRRCLERFCLASGQKISLHKSMVYFSKNTGEATKEDGSRELGIPITRKYLRLPSINGRVIRHTFQAIFERINWKLAGWKSHTLSMAGRATLIQSAIASIPTYVMQTVKLPRTLCDEIHRKSRRFSWGGSEQTKRFHNVSWGQIIQAKQAGGLGFRSARETNAAFLTKLGWRLLVEKDKLWSEVLQAKYCQNRCSNLKQMPPTLGEELLKIWTSWNKVRGPK